MLVETITCYCICDDLLVARSAQEFVLRLELIILAYPLRRTIEVLA